MIDDDFLKLIKVRTAPWISWGEPQTILGGHDPPPPSIRLCAVSNILSEVTTTKKNSNRKSELKKKLQMDSQESDFFMTLATISLYWKKPKLRGSSDREAVDSDPSRPLVGKKKRQTNWSRLSKEQYSPDPKPLPSQVHCDRSTRRPFQETSQRSRWWWSCPRYSWLATYLAVTRLGLTHHLFN